MPDDRAFDAQLEQHGGGDLAGERAFRCPVDVLRVDRDPAPDGGGKRREGRADDDLDAAGGLECLEERYGLPRPLEQLPVARDEHEG